jgi:hypothetical protein
VKKILIVFYSLILIINANAQNWMILNTGIKHHLFSVHFEGPDTGYAFGECGIIIKMTN